MCPPDSSRAATALSHDAGLPIWIAVAMVVLGFFYNPLLPLVALFVWFAGTRELWSVRMRHGELPFSFGARKSPAGPFADAFDARPVDDDRAPGARPAAC